MEMMPIPNGSAVAAGHNLHVKLRYCANDLRVRMPAIALKLISIPQTYTAPWQSAPTVPEPLTGDTLHTFLDGGSIYQVVPDDPNPTNVYVFIPRLLSKPGALPDDNILAQGDIFTFTVCHRFNGVTCL
jgi:hypothetical protein